jgi:hypothetical protein
MRLVLNVAAVSEWRAPDFDVVLPRGEHELPNDDVKLTRGLARAIAAAAGAGVLEIVEADAKAAKLIDGVVESDEDSLLAYENAIESGVWLEGHLEDVIAQRKNRALELAEQLKGSDEKSAKEILAHAEFNDGLLAEAKARLAALRGET